MTAEVDSVEDGPEDYEDVPAPPARWLRRVGLALLVAAMVILTVTGAGAVWVLRHVDPPGDPGDEVTLAIPNGSSTTRIAELLQDEGVITNSTVFRFYVRFKDAGPFQAGEYVFRARDAMGEVVKVLEAGPIVRFEDVTIPEGLTVEEIIPLVGPPDGITRFDPDAFRLALEDPELRSRYQPPDIDLMEGLVFPETYRVDERETEADLARRMVATLDEVAMSLGYDDAPARVGFSPYEVLVVASLIEEEAKVDEDRAKIARVIYNRLEAGWTLGIDATVIYVTGDQRITRSDLEVDSPYNTRRFPGLPPTPIAAPGRASLEAALNPEDGDWMYYVLTDPDGLHHSFSVTDAEFQRDKRICQQVGNC